VNGVWSVGVLPAGITVTLEITATVLGSGTYESLAEVTAHNQADRDSIPANARTKPEDDDDVASVSVTAGGGGAAEECIGKVIISEIAWSGTAADSTHEWIELRNLGSEPIDLTGWSLQWRKRNPITPEDYELEITVPLSGFLGGADTGFSACEIALQDPEPSVEFEKREYDDISWNVVSRDDIERGGHYILERLTDQTIPRIEAGKVYDDPANPELELWDDGAIMELVNAAGDVVDTANAYAAPRVGWPAGDAATHGTMERTNALGPDEPGNWHTNIGITTRGTDAEGRPLIATANALNSQSLEEWTVFTQLDPSVRFAGSRLDVGLELMQAERRESGWPWIRVTRPIASSVTGGGAAVEMPSSYSFSGRFSVDRYWLGIDTAGLAPGVHLIWIVYGEGEAVLVPIMILP